MSGPYDYAAAQVAVHPVGQNVTHTTATHRYAEVHHNQPPPVAHGYHHHHGNSSSSSSGSSYRGHHAGHAGHTGHAGAYHHHAAHGVVGDAACGSHRQARHQRQVIRLPDHPQGPVRQIRHRLPTPEPDTLERVYIQRSPPEVVEEITEVPTTPPPIIQERTVVEPAPPPQVVRRCVRVPPRSRGYASSQHVAAPCAQSSHLLSAGSYGSVQQASAGYQHYGGYAAAPAYSAPYSGGYGAPASAGYASYGAVQQPQPFCFVTQAPQQRAAIPQASCFYA